MEKPLGVRIPCTREAPRKLLLAVNKSNCLFDSKFQRKQRALCPAVPATAYPLCNFSVPSFKERNFNEPSSSDKKYFTHLLSGSFLLQICNVFFFYIIQASLCCLRATQQIYISFARRSSRSVSRFLSFLHSGENPPLFFLFLFFIFYFLISQVEIISPSLVYIYFVYIKDLKET
jgi:hypothetical protein